MRPRFFASVPASADAGPKGAVVPGLVVQLGEVDARHARAVLRARAGDECEVVFSDAGVAADCVFTGVGRVVAVRVEAVRPEPPRHVRLQLVQALPRPSKVDEVVEKGTEVGFDAFLIAPAAASPAVPWEKLQRRLERWRAVAGSAAKQSRQPAVPEVRAARSLEEALGIVAAEGYRSVVLAPGEPRHLGEIIGAETAGPPPGGAPTLLEAARRGPAAVDRRTPSATARWAIWVGPEAGWSAEELRRLKDRGALEAGLGPRVLRTETAGPVAGGVVRYVLSDW